MKRSIVAQLTAIALLLFVVSAPAQTPAPPQAEEGDVVLNGQTVIRILAPAGQVSAKDRAAAVQQRLDRATQEGPIAPADVVVRVVDANPSIFVKNRLILTVYGADAQAYNLSAAALAESWAAKLREVLKGAPASPPPSAPAPSRPAPGPAPTPAPSSPAPAATGGTPWPPPVIAARYRAQSLHFRNGFAAGLNDALSLFALGADGWGRNDDKETVTLFKCFEGHANKQLDTWTAWIDSTVTKATNSEPVAILAGACQTTWEPILGEVYLDDVADYRRLNDPGFRMGFGAGVYDMVSFFAVAAQSSAGVDKRKIAELHECLYTRTGGTLGDLRAWVDSAIASTPANSTVVSSILSACQGKR